MTASREQWCGAAAAVALMVAASVAAVAVVVGAGIVRCLEGRRR